MDEPTYKDRERTYLIKIIEDAEDEWYSNHRAVKGVGAVPRFCDYIADAILSKGFSYKGGSGS